MNFHDFLSKFSVPMITPNQKFHSEQLMLSQYHSNIPHYNFMIYNAFENMFAHCNKRCNVEIALTGGSFGIAKCGENRITVDPTIAVLDPSFLIFICSHELGHLVHYDSYGNGGSEENADDFAAEYMGKNNIDIRGTLHTLMKLPYTGGKHEHDPHLDPRERAYQVFNTYNKFA